MERPQCVPYAREFKFAVIGDTYANEIVLKALRDLRSRWR